VLVNVLLVLKPVLTVTLVMLTEFLHHNVNVLMDIMKTDVLVKPVHTGVKLVTPPPNVGNVLETESLYHSVLVNQVPMMMELNSVKLVVIHVSLVLINGFVNLVLVSEPLSLIAHAQIHTMKKKTDNVNYVPLDVLPVTSTKITVKSVEMTDNTHQSVHVFQEPSKFQTLMN
jgi:hypothetical protein